MIVNGNLRTASYAVSASLFLLTSCGQTSPYTGYTGALGTTSGGTSGASNYQGFGSNAGLTGSPLGGSLVGGTSGGTSPAGGSSGYGNSSTTPGYGTVIQIGSNPVTAPTDENGNPISIVYVYGPSLLEHSPGCNGGFDHYGNNVYCPAPPSAGGTYYPTGGGAQCQQPPDGGVMLDSYPLSQNGATVGWHVDCCSSESPGVIPQFANAIYVICAYSAPNT